MLKNKFETSCKLFFQVGRRAIWISRMCSFNQKLAYKAERAGKLFVQIDAKGTSQECPNCGRMAAKTLSQRIHDCPFGYKDEDKVGTTGTKACGWPTNTSWKREASRLDEARSPARVRGSSLRVASILRSEENVQSG